MAPSISCIASVLASRTDVNLSIWSGASFVVAMTVPACSDDCRVPHLLSGIPQQHEWLRPETSGVLATDFVEAPG
jgi:hypothetical protein